MNRDLSLNSNWRDGEKRAMRDGYGESLKKIMDTNKSVVVLVADLIESMRLSDVAEFHEKRLVEMGIAEQNMAGVGAGMAMVGLVPLINSFAVFNPGRNWEQIRVSVCMNNANVKIVGGHAGFGNGFDGANQQAFEDIAITRCLPNMRVIAPADYEQVKKALVAVIESVGPCYLRITKPNRPVVTTNMTPFELGKAQVFRQGRDVTVFACGQMVYEALVAAHDLEGRVDVGVINVHTIKPIDKETVVVNAKKTGRVVVAEEHSIVGGLGGAVAELLGEECPTKMKFVGMNDTWGESGSPEALMEKYDMTSRAIIAKIEELMKL